MTYQVLIIACTVLLYLFFFYATGSIAVRFVPAADFSFSRTIILGFFLYHFLFTLLCLPMKLMLMPLSTLSAVWAVLLTVILILFLFLERKQWGTKWERLRSHFSGKQKYLTLAFLVLILAQVLWFNWNDETYAIWDQSYYLGDTATSLYTNTLSQYNPYTGRILDCLNDEYLLETYQNHSAVMCQLLHLHPMVETMTVMASVVIILYQLIAFELGKYLFHGNRTKAVVMTAFLFLLNSYSFNLFTAAEFLIIRPSEGKTILAVLIIPALLYFFLKTSANPAQKAYWWYSFFVILGSFGLNMSSIFMIPFELSALYLPLALKKKKFSIVLGFVILMIPCGVMAALYLLTKHSLVIYTGK